MSVRNSDLAPSVRPVRTAMPDVVPLVDPGLGNSAYLVDLGDGRALAVDPSRDVRALQLAAHRSGLTVAFVADTHLHADFVSGARQLVASDGATVLASAAGRREFEHVGLVDGDEVDLGGLRLRALATPGHTDEHLAYLLLDGDSPLGVFSGGSLIVGAVARTDLVHEDRTVELALAQYASVHALAMLPDDVALWPTHGTGSFCSAPPGAERTSTIGTEKATNPLLAAATEDSFVDALLASLGTYPSYFARLAEVNRRGPAVLDPGLPVPRLDARHVSRLLAAGAVLVDTRPAADYAAGHVTGSLSIPFRDAFATWLGWVVPPDRPLVLLRGDEQDAADLAWQAAKVGYDTVVGELAGGWPAAVDAGLPVSRTRQVLPHQVTPGRPVLDVRQAGEFASGHLPGARHLELGALAADPGAAADTAVVMCGHGERAMTAASLLEAAGHPSPAVLVGGAPDWAAVHGATLQTGA